MYKFQYRLFLIVILLLTFFILLNSCGVKSEFKDVSDVTNKDLEKFYYGYIDEVNGDNDLDKTVDKYFSKSMLKDVDIKSVKEVLEKNREDGITFKGKILKNEIDPNTSEIFLTIEEKIYQKGKELEEAISEGVYIVALEDNYLKITDVVNLGSDNFESNEIPLDDGWEIENNKTDDVPLEEGWEIEE